MTAIKSLIDIAGPAVYLVMLILAGWILYQTGWQHLSLTLNTQPLTLTGQLGQMLTAIALVTLISATVGINIIANFVSGAFDFSHCAPQKISFHGGGMIAAISYVLIMPWNLFHSPSLIHDTLDVLGACLGPLFAILIMAFYLIQGGNVNIDDLFNASP